MIFCQTDYQWLISFRPPPVIFQTLDGSSRTLCWGYLFLHPHSIPKLSMALVKLFKSPIFHYSIHPMKLSFFFSCNYIPKWKHQLYTLRWCLFFGWIEKAKIFGFFYSAKSNSLTSSNIIKLNLLIIS